MFTVINCAFLQSFDLGQVVVLILRSNGVLEYVRGQEFFKYNMDSSPSSINLPCPSLTIHSTPAHNASIFAIDNPTSPLYLPLIINTSASCHGSTSFIFYKRWRCTRFCAIRLARYSGQLGSWPYLCTPPAALGFVPLSNTPNSNSELCCCGCELCLKQVLASANSSVADSNSALPSAELVMGIAATGRNVHSQTSTATAHTPASGSAARIEEISERSALQSDTGGLVSLATARSLVYNIMCFVDALHSPSCLYGSMEIPKNEGVHVTV